MAYQLVSTNGQVQYNINEYVIDTPEDLNKLPKNCAMGSQALCLSNGSIYMKDGTHTWKLFSSNGGSSSGGGSNVGTISYNSLTDKPTLNGTIIQGEMEIDSIPNEFIDNLFVH